MKCLENEDYKIFYQEDLEPFVAKAVNYAVKKKKENCKFFACKTTDIPKLKASIFTNRADFIKCIQQYFQKPVEDWVEGCFYNGEIQMYVDLSNKKKAEHRMGTLAHETVHLMFDKLIYEKYKINRLVWLDESFANYLDGVALSWSDNSWDKLVERLLPYKNFNVNNLNNWNKVVTKKYNGYDMFHIIGRYVFENDMGHELIEMLKADRNQIMQLGRTILSSALTWYKTKNNEIKE